MTWRQPETLVALITASGGILTAARLWMRQRANDRQLAAQGAELARRGDAEDNLALLRTAIDAYRANSSQLQDQLTQTRQEQAQDRARHAGELETIRVHLEGCESDRAVQGRQIAQLRAEVDAMKEASR